MRYTTTHETADAPAPPETRPVPQAGTTVPVAPATPGRAAERRAGPDARRARRRPIKESTKVHCYGNALGLGRNIASALLDVSEAGVRLTVKIPVEVGQEVEINLHGQTGVSARHIARVVWAVPAEGGLFCVGCALAKPLPYATLVALARV
jgi:hypothetical protein